MYKLFKEHHSNCYCRDVFLVKYIKPAMVEIMAGVGRKENSFRVNVKDILSIRILHKYCYTYLYQLYIILLLFIITNVSHCTRLDAADI